MIVLLFFSLLAGIVTALSPCILPVLPLLLSAGIGQSRYRPQGIIIGLIASFTFFTLTLSTIVRETGISPDVLRYTSIGLIILFGLTMILPDLERLLNKLASPLTRLGNRLQNNVSHAGSGFLSGLILGIALGLIWAPCAGPILATITTLVATQSVTWTTFILTLAYAIGTAIPMFLIMYGGGKISSSISSLMPYTELIRKIFGVIMILGALAIAFHADVLFQQIAVRYFPMITIEDNELVKKELMQLQRKTNAQSPIVGFPAPQLVGISAWLNSPALSLEELKGKVVLVDFWTYSCINCVRTLPHLKEWYAKYKDKNFIIIGVHTPEFEFEKSTDNVKDAVKRFELTYPIALDNNYSTWQNYNNHYWPAHYLIDQKGIIREIHFGEGQYQKTENMIRSLLGFSPELKDEEKSRTSIQQTPETYLGYKRGEKYTSEIIIHPYATHNYTFLNPIAPDHVGLKGDWLVESESITSKDDSATLTLNFIGQHVYLVLSAQQPSFIGILFDGQAIANASYSKDMNADGKILVTESRMYEIINTRDNKRHLLTLQIPNGVSLYAFTFGSD